jgi:ketosteroid isomerase-like protein
MEVIQNLYAAFDRNDGASILALLGPNLDWNEAENFTLSDRNPYQTPEAVAEGVFGRLATMLNGYKVKIPELFDAGETIIAVGRMQGTVVKTGKFFDAQFAHVWRVKGEKIVGFQQYCDTLGIAKAMGEV